MSIFNTGESSKRSEHKQSPQQPERNQLKFSKRRVKLGKMHVTKSGLNLDNFVSKIWVQFGSQVKEIEAPKSKRYNEAVCDTYFK